MAKNDTEEQDPIINDEVKETAPVAAVTPYNEVEEIKVVKDTPMTPDKEETATQKTWRQLADETIEERRKGQQEKDEAADKRMKWRKALSTISDVTGGIANLIAVGKGAKNIERNDALDAYNKEYKEMIAARNARREEDNLTRAEGVAKDFKEAKDLQALAASRAADEAAAKRKHDRDKELWEIRFQGQKDVEDVRGQNRIDVEEKRNEGKVNVAKENAKGKVSAVYSKTKVDKETEAMKERGRNRRTELNAWSKVKTSPRSTTVGDVSRGIGDDYVEEYLEDNKSANNSSNAGGNSGNDSNSKPRIGR